LPLDKFLHNLGASFFLPRHQKPQLCLAALLARTTCDM